MAVSFSEILEIKNSLSQQYITVSDEWIEACATFVKQEQGQNMPLQNLKKSVYQQWLVADLEEIACSSLPPQLTTLQKITLKDSFALQVQGIRDVSKPAYSQLKQLEGSVNSNAEYSSVPKTAVPEWEAKPTRMLMLNLTDGCSHIQGMEYRTINCLSPNLHPGIKVLIKGPVECRFGVLLLQPENIRILGGEVESKLLQYSRENMLKMQLQIPTGEDNLEELPVDNSNLVNNGLETADRVNISSEIPSLNNRNSALSAQNDQNQGSRNISKTLASHNVNERNSSNIQNSYQSGNQREIRSDDDTPDLLDNFGSDDEFEQILDYEKIDEIENTQRQVETITSQPPQNEHDLWEEDEDVVREMMEFQDADPTFDMPFEIEAESSGTRKSQKCPPNISPVFTYLSSVSSNPLSDSLITIKGFIITVLSKLECTPSSGWNLLVKINDGTASLDVSIHDKVLENIIGVSAQDMMKKKTLAAKDTQIRTEVLEAISNCKRTLQNLNCLMDVKFTPGEKPSIMKLSEVSLKQVQQMIERTRCMF